ncbi:Mur ligase family protein [Gracilibacillus halophilus]|uniref:Mur ligase family protein n=1 Tax=Gracilibacillus halophilus TaxID=470864 RepID=UPI0003AAD151|nr:UDP-N-acetylmuramoyl-tripeptide--D-alanyl-D-alanine ligase [Gracilibacillus halophilus]
MQISFTILVVIWMMSQLFRIKQSIHMLQLNGYFNNRFLHWMKQHRTKVVPVNEWFALVSIILIIFNTYWIVALLPLLLLWIPTGKTNQEKKKLAYTPRVKRLLTTIALIYLLLVATILHFVWREDSLLIATVLLLISSMATYGFVLLANLINRPIENAIKQSYYKDASQIISQMPDLKKVGITGSFGKTSTKFILDTILTTHFNTLKTPESFNTKIGVTITVRNSLKPYHDVFIAEMGAKEPGNIQEICELVGHNYAVLTAIGEQHLETFKTLDNIKKTKYEIVESLPEDGTAFLNRDDENIMSYTPKNPCRRIYFAIDDETADYVASDIYYHNKGTTFRVTNKAGSLDATFDTKLLGKHNVYNMLAAISVAWEMGVPLHKLQLGVKKVQAVKHRMEIKKDSAD